MAVLFDNLLEITVPNSPGWSDIDLSVPPFSLPSNAVGVMVMVENVGASSNEVGLQMNYPTNKIYPDEMRTFFIGVDEFQVVEFHNESDDMRFWLVGYFDSNDAVFYTNGFEHSMVTTPGVWTTEALMEQPPDSLAALFYVSIAEANPTFGVRRTTCLDDFKTLFSLIGGAISSVHIDTGVAYVDLYAGSASTRIWDVGYLKRGTFKDNLVDITPAVSGSWQTIDLSADAGIDDASAIIFAYDQLGNGESYGIRSLSSTQEFYHKADMENWYVVKFGGYKQFQAKVSSTSMKLYVVGYLYGSYLSQTRVPTGDSPVQWIPSTGTDNYAMVDEYPAISDTDYNYTPDPSRKDKFTFTPFSVPAGSDIIGVTVYVRGKCSDFVVPQMGPFLTVGGVEDDYVMPFPVDFQENTFFWPVNPKTSIAWTVDDVNGIGANTLQFFGYLSEAGVGYTCTVSRIYIKVDYIPSPPPPPPIPTNSELMRHLQYFHGGINYGCYTGSRGGGGT